jgi:murein DD-endopeptidase MepM/ murein hydrolase activator NlpD
MEEGRPLVAVAPGVIVGAQFRDISPNAASATQSACQARYQGEVSLLIQVDTSWYAEYFVAVYHHMDDIPVVVGQQVHRGDVIAHIGNSGSSGAPHLDLQVVRTTNTVGAYWYTYKPTSYGYGYNGLQADIDPFGWAGGPIDPFAYRYLGFDFQSFDKANNLAFANGDPLQGYVSSSTPFGPGHGYGDPGAFSINLWVPGNEPPNRKPL